MAGMDVDTSNTAAGLADLRCINKPGKYGNDKSEWADWRFDFENFMCVVDPEYGSEMEGSSAPEITKPAVSSKPAR